MCFWIELKWAAINSNSASLYIVFTSLFLSWALLLSGSDGFLLKFGIAFGRVPDFQSDGRKLTEVPFSPNEGRNRKEVGYGSLV